MSTNTASRRFARLGTAIGITLILAGCSAGGPPPVTYVLGPPAPESASVQRLTGRPVIELKRVLVPDYLDVSDMMVRRSESVLAPSPTGHWGERLSVGVTRVLAYDLSLRLPDFVVTTNPIGTTAAQVLVEVEDFAPRADGTVVLLARWRVLNGAGNETLAGEQISLTDKAAGSGDSAIAAAMTREINDLAAQVAAGVRQAMPGPRRTGHDGGRRS